VAQRDLSAQYREAAKDAARENEARAWSEGLVTVMGKAGMAMADQVMTADKQRLKRRIGKVTAAEMLGIERALRVQLGLR